MSCTIGGLNSEWYHIGDLNSEIVTVSYKVPTKKGMPSFFKMKHYWNSYVVPSMYTVKKVHILRGMQIYSTMFQRNFTPTESDNLCLYRYPHC